MNWEAIGAVGEILGAAGVIITLVYLAGQLRQNTRALRSESYQHWNEVASSYAQFTAQYAVELSEIEELSSLDQLTPEQQKIMGMWGLLATNQAETAFLQHRAGTLDNDVFEARVRAYVGFFVETNLGRESWPKFIKPYNTPDFVKYIESRVAGLGPDGGG
jgi:hypothetical protein